MKKEKISFICCLITSLCFYISAILDIINKDDNWVIGLCLGTAFLCLLGIDWNKSQSKAKKKK